MEGYADLGGGKDRRTGSLKEQLRLSEAARQTISSQGSCDRKRGAAQCGHDSYGYYINGASALYNACRAQGIHSQLHTCTPDLRWRREVCPTNPSP